MPKVILFEGRRYSFPDDATEAEISQAIDSTSQAVPTPPEPTRTIGSYLGGIPRGAANAVAAVPDVIGSVLNVAGAPGGQMLDNLAETIRKGAEHYFVPPEQPNYGDALMEGLGQLLPTVAGGAALGVAKGVAWGTRGALALAGMAELNDAEQAELQRQKEAGEPEDRVRALAKGAAYAAVATAIESKLGVGRIFKQFEAAMGGDAAKRTIGQIARKIAAQTPGNAAAGFTEETLQRMAQDMIVKGEIDLSAAAYEGAVGAPLQALGGAGGTLAGSVVAPEPAAPVPPPATQPPAQPSTEPTSIATGEIPEEGKGRGVPADQLLPQNLAKHNEEVVVPGEGTSPTTVSPAVQRIRSSNARTVAQIQALFPEEQLSREQARGLRNQAWEPELLAATDLQRSLIQNQIPAKEVIQSENAQETQKGKEVLTQQAGAAIPQPALPSPVQTQPVEQPTRLSVVLAEEFPHLQNVEVAEAGQPLPPSLVAEAQSRGLDPNAIEAAYHRGRVVFNAARFQGATRQQVREKIVHEVAIHHGLRAALGPKRFSTLSQQVWDSLNTSEREQIARRNGIKLTDTMQIGEEWLAYESERVSRSGKADGLWSRIVQAVRRTLRAAGITLRFSDTEIAGLIAKGMKGAVEKSSWGSRMSVEKPTPFESAKRIFGVTDNVSEAGYVLPDGTLLDFSGRNQMQDSYEMSGDRWVPKGGRRDYQQGVRHVDHREIEWDDMPKFAENWQAMVEFMKLGAVRIDANSGLISVHGRQQLTSAQEQVVRDIVIRGNGAAVDMEDDAGQKAGIMFEGAIPAKVIGSLRKWAAGQTPESGTRFSVFMPAGTGIDQVLSDLGLPTNFRTLPVGAQKAALTRLMQDRNIEVGQLYGTEKWAKALGKISGVGPWIEALQGGKARINEPEMLALATWAFEKHGIAQAQAGMIGELLAGRVNKAFKPSKEGDLSVEPRVKGMSLKTSDVFGTLRVDPTAYRLTPEQQETWQELKALSERFEKLALDYGVISEASLDPAYFFRRALEVPDVERAGGKGKRGVGRKPTFAHERFFKTEREGWAADIRYETNIEKLITSSVQDLYESIAAKRLVANPALNWETPRQLKLRMLHEAAAHKGGALTMAEVKEVVQKVNLRAAKMQVYNVPAFFNKLFEPRIAQMINREFAAESSSWRKAIIKTSGAVKGVRFGLDLGVHAIQMMPTFYSNPVVWSRSVAAAFQAMANKNYFGGFVRNHINAVMELADQGSPVGRLPEHLSGLAEGQILTGKWAKRLGVGHVIEAFGRHFQTALDVAKVLLWEARSKTVPKSQWPQLIRQIESQLLIGRAESGFLTHNRAMTERVLLLAPTYYRGALDFIAGLTQGGVVGALQWKVASSFIGGSIAMFWVVGKQLGMDDEELKKRMTPTSPEFLLWRIKDGAQELNIGIGGIFRSLFRLTGQLYAASKDHGADDKFWVSKDNPAIRWFRGHSSPVVSGIWDFISGRDYMGKELAGLGNIGTLVVPAAANTASPREALGSFFGLTAFPEGVYKRRQRRIEEDTGKPMGELAYGERLKAARAVAPEINRLRESQGVESERRSAVYSVEQQQRRAEQLQNDLPKDIRKWVEQNKLKIPGYSTTFSLGRTAVPLTDEEYTKLHQLMVTEYEKGLRRLMAQPTFDGSSETVKRARLQAVLEAARLRGRAAFRRGLGK